MSARVDAVENIRQKLPGILFWVGIGLAPVAALLLLVAEGDGLLRIVAVLAVLAVVLIGLSITLRGDNETIRLAMHKTLLEEIDMLREDLRNDIARAAHSAVGERLQVVQDDVAALRHQLAAGRGEAWAAGAPPADSSRGDAPDGSRAGDSAHDAYAPAADEPGERGEWRRPPTGVAAVAAAGVDSGGRHSSDSRGARGAAEGRAQVRASAAIPRPRSPMSGALVQHTETVQVTTRHTIVNTTSAGDVSGGRVYGAAGYDSGRDDPLSAEIGGSHGSSGPRHGRAEDWGDEAGQEDRWARSYSERTWSDGSWSQSDESWARGGDEAWSRGEGELGRAEGGARPRGAGRPRGGVCLGAARRGALVGAPVLAGRGLAKRGPAGRELAGPLAQRRRPGLAEGSAVDRREPPGRGIRVDGPAVGVVERPERAGVGLARRGAARQRAVGLGRPMVREPMVSQPMVRRPVVRDGRVWLAGAGAGTRARARRPPLPGRGRRARLAAAVRAELEHRLLRPRLAVSRSLVDVADDEEHRAEDGDQVGDQAAGQQLWTAPARWRTTRCAASAATASSRRGTPGSSR